MDPIIGGMLIGLAAGAGKNLLFDEPARRQQNIYNATTTALSPWTGLKSQGPVASNMGSDLFQGALTGATMGQQYGAAEAQKNLLETQTKLLQKSAPLDASSAAKTTSIRSQQDLQNVYGNINRAVPGLNLQGAFAPMQYQSIPPVQNKWTGMATLGRAY